jgi:lysophospholipase L1-like esterase
MPATGVSGVDLYVEHETAWRWCATLKPATQTVGAALIQNMPAQPRKFQINFPLYNGLKSFEIGTAQKSAFNAIPPRKDKPILFYGTSITQGGCASRPGMAFVAILGRRLDRPMLNFGFSGQGKMEVEVARFLAEIDAQIFVLDCLANMGAVPVTAKTIAVVKLLREKRPETPILLLEERRWSDQWILPRRDENHQQRCRDLRAAYDSLTAEGVKNLHYLKGDDFLGSDDEGTVDGSHPSDLGMIRYADALEPELRKLL